MKKFFIFIFILFIIFIYPLSAFSQSLTPTPTGTRTTVDINVNVSTTSTPDSSRGVWDFLKALFREYKREFYTWLGWSAGIFTIGVYGLLFPIFYYLVHLHPSITIRISYLVGLIFSYLAFHLIFFIPFWPNCWMDYRLWLIWFIILVFIVLVVLLMPKNRKAF